MNSDMLIHPGEILKEEFLIPHGLSATAVANAIGLSPNRITQIVNRERSVSAETAILLGHAFGTSSEFWLNIQARHDLDLAMATVSTDRVRRAAAFARGLLEA